MQLTKINNKPSNGHKMSVLIHQDGLSFLCYNEDNMVERWNYSFKYESNPIEILEELQKVYLEHTTLSEREFEKVTVVYHHPIFSGVPASLFDQEQVANYLKYNNRLLETDIISHDDPIDVLEYQTVYIAFSNINNFFFDLYGDFDYYHYTSLALPKWHQRHSNQENTVILDVKKSHLYLTIFKEGILVLHNIYQHDAIEDILYYTLFASQHNGLQPDQISLYLYQNDPSKALYDLLYTYVKEVNVVVGAPQIIEQFLCV